MSSLLLRTAAKKIVKKPGEVDPEYKQQQQHAGGVSGTGAQSGVATGGSSALGSLAVATATGAGHGSQVSPSSGSALSSGTADGDFLVNRHLPRFHQSRRVLRSVLIPNLPSLRDAPPSQRAKLLSKKLRLCCYVFEPTTDEAVLAQDLKDKELKRGTMLELISYLTVFKPSFTEDQLNEIFEMLYLNLIRTLPPNAFEARAGVSPEDEEYQAEMWPQLQVVYEFLLRLATATETDARLLDRYFSQSFVLGLLDLFDSDDLRERDYLKTILHRIYGNFMSLRPFIRRAINNVFYRLIYEADHHQGIAELLEILGSIINGFALPLKEQHKQFLVKVLLPLHKVSNIVSFHPQLSYCVTQFLEKDPTLAPKIIDAIIRYWPETNSKKEVMFLNELEEILDRVQPRLLGDCQINLFRRLAKCIRSPHFQVAERALYILNNDFILRFVTSHRTTLLPILAEALFSNTHPMGQAPPPATPPPGPAWVPGASTRPHGHWSSTIAELTRDILKLFTEMDPALMNSCRDKFNRSIAQEAQLKADSAAKWAAVEARALPILQQLGIPYTDDNALDPPSKRGLPYIIPTRSANYGLDASDK